VKAFELVRDWPASSVAIAVIDPNEQLHVYGDRKSEFRLASVTKLMTAWVTLIAVEDGSISLDDPIGQPGCTLRHLLTHAGGYGFDGIEPIVTPERKRVYSNTGYDMIAEYVSSATEIAFADYLDEAVFQALGMTSTQLRGGAAWGAYSTLEDLIPFIGELRRPSLIDNSTFIAATSSQFPNLEGVIPGLGRFNPCPWGLGPELRGTKLPHWTGTRNSSSTYGHFGGSGTFVWIDPVANVACCALADLEFGDWALTHWPIFSDAVLSELGR